MKVAVFDTHRFEREGLDREAKKRNLELSFFETRLSPTTARLAKGFQAVVVFVNDHLDRETLQVLQQENVRLIATRSAGFNHIDMVSAQELGLPVVRVPEYSPSAVAEFAVGLLLTLNRKVHKAYLRTHELNFSLDGLVGFDLRGKTVGVVGTGKIGVLFAEIMKGFGCEVLAYDLQPKIDWANQKQIRYVELQDLWAKSDVISLHIPLNPQTKHIVSKRVFSQLKRGAILINTGRGALIDTKDLISALKAGTLGGAALDVYEEEEGVFFEDLSEKGLSDDLLARLLTFPNVLITSHQAFLTKEALQNIAETTMQSLADFAAGKVLRFQVQK